MRDESIQELAGLLGLPYRINHIPKTKADGTRAPNRSGRKRVGLPKKDTTHGTANKKPGATAAMHEKYVRAPNWGGPAKTSYHHVVDDIEAIELLPWEEEAYHGGTPESNLYWLGQEICENAGHYGPKAIENAAKLQACKLVKFEKPLSWIVQHHEAYGKNCPTQLRAGNPITWEQYLEKIAHYANLLRAALQGAPQPPQPPVDNKTAISTFWAQNPWLGLPLWGDERAKTLEDGQVWQCQLFERGLVQWRADAGAMLARIGWMWAVEAGEL